jgi:hypothetical protein
MGNERIVVVKEQKRGGFWPFVGGLLIGAAVVKLAGDYVEKSKKSKEPESEPQPTAEIKNQDEIRLIEDLIDELVSKPNKTQKDKNNIDLLRIKLGQLRNG